MAVTKIKLNKGEEWKVIPKHTTAKGEKYAITSKGRLIKFAKDITEGSELRLSHQSGYPIWRVKKTDGSYFALLIHRLVARYFLPKPEAKKKYIIHLDFDKANNSVKNLRWATQQEVNQHASKNPAVIAAREAMKNRTRHVNAKLTIPKVKRIKTMLAKGHTLSKIAHEFGISDMQVYRIKSGQNWKQVTL